MNMVGARNLEKCFHFYSIAGQEKVGSEENILKK